MRTLEIHELDYVAGGVQGISTCPLVLTVSMSVGGGLGLIGGSAFGIYLGHTVSAFFSVVGAFVGAFSGTAVGGAVGLLFGIPAGLIHDFCTGS
jgi:hypothetical protein